MRPAKGAFLSELFDFAMSYLPEDMYFIDEYDDFDYSNFDVDLDDDEIISENTEINILNNPTQLK